MDSTLKPTTTLDEAVSVTELIDRGRTFALHVAMVLMLVSGISPLVAFNVGVEHLPYGLAVAVLCAKRPPPAFLLTAGAATLFWGLSHFYWGDWGNWIYLVQFINVLTPLVFFTTLRTEIERAAYWVFWAYVVVALLQTFRLLVFAEPFLDYLIPRFRGETENGYRGVAALESEPARAAFQMLMLYVMARAKFRNSLVGFGMLIVTQVLLIQATSGLMLTAGLCAFLVVAAARRTPKYVPVFVAGVIFVAVAAFFMNPKVELIAEKSVEDGVTGLRDSLAATSGGRYLALEDAIVDILTQPFGRGADPDYFAGDELELVQLDAFDNRYLVERGSRPVSAVLNGIRTFGVLMAFAVAWAIKQSLFDGRRPNYNAYFFFVIFCALVYGPSGSEALLIALGFAGQPAHEPQPHEPQPVVLESAT